MGAEQTGKNGRKVNKEINSTLLIVALMTIGVIVMSYPVLSNLYNKMTGSYAIQEFNKQIADQSVLAMRDQRMMAEIYNNSLLNGQAECEYAYEEIMDFGNGMMGYIEIPVIDVYLPVYHSVDESVLSKGVGHISRTAFPIGGEGNHSVLSGHTGLPSAELFTNLTEVKEGDEFYVHILGDIVAYEVDQISVVLPEEADGLQPVAGKDYCTLVTCTPYGVNSHRLLVRGQRISYTGNEEVVNIGRETTVNVFAAIGGAVGLICIFLLLTAVVIKRMGLMLTIVLICILNAAPEVYAAEGIRTEEKCMVQVDLRNSGFEELTGEQALPIEIELYKVAHIDAAGNYLALPDFHMMDFSVVDAETTPKEWKKLAVDAMGLIETGEISATAVGTTECGEVTIGNLETGLYLVKVQRTMSDAYVYTFTPFLVSLPNNYYYSTGEDCWVYDLTEEYAVRLKTDRTELKKPEEPNATEEENFPEKEVTTEITDIVETGDEGQTVLYMLLILSSGVVVLKLKKKKQRTGCRF